MKDWSRADKPREKLIDQGRRALSDAELLAVLVGTGNKTENVLDVCRNILVDVGHDLHMLAGFSVDDLCKYNGMGVAKALRVVAALELGRRRDNAKFEERPKINSSSEVYNYLKPIYQDLKHEESWVIYLDASCRVLRKVMIGKGGIDFTPVEVKTIIRIGLECYSKAIVLSHNHPSGNTSPSKADIYLTDKVIKACDFFDIQVFDHIIFTNDGYLSFQDDGLME